MSLHEIICIVLKIKIGMEILILSLIFHFIFKDLILLYRESKSSYHSQVALRISYFTFFYSLSSLNSISLVSEIVFTKCSTVVS